MVKTIEWKKKLFGDDYTLFENNSMIGELKYNSFKGKAHGELHGKQFDFSNKGFLKQNTWISETNQEGMISNIKFDSWRTMAEIIYLGKKYIWKSESAWESSRVIICADRPILRITGGSTKGNIELFEEVDEMLVLASLYLCNYYLVIMLVTISMILVTVSQMIIATNRHDKILGLFNELTK